MPLGWGLGRLGLRRFGGGLCVPGGFYVRLRVPRSRDCRGTRIFCHPGRIRSAPRIICKIHGAGFGDGRRAFPVHGLPYVFQPAPVPGQQCLALCIICGIMLQQRYAALQHPPLRVEGRTLSFAGAPHQGRGGHAGHAAEGNRDLLHLCIPLDPGVLSDLGIGETTAGAAIVPLVQRVLTASSAPYVRLLPSQLSL